MQNKTFDDLMRRFREIEFEHEFDIVCAIANGGIVPAGIINQRLNADFKILRINLRDEQQRPKFDKLAITCSHRFRNQGKTHSFGR
jgi:uncharacterized protein